MANNEYVAELKEIISNISPSLVDFDLAREKGRIPTQASSEFITNREQGDWAENLILQAINEGNLNYCAVKYGKSEQRVTGEDGFEAFFLDYQSELDTIGKRPDILIFNREKYKVEWEYDISTLPLDVLAGIVPLAEAGIEIRSSSFLYDVYSKSQEVDAACRIKRVLEIREQLLSDYVDILTAKTGWVEIIKEISRNTINMVSFRTPSWSSSMRHSEASSLLKELKKNISAYQKRTHLSITPKVEDIKAVTKWIEHYKIPHFYFQVFFDKVFGIPFKDILELLADPANEDVKYFLEDDVKNQNKTTIKINPLLGFLVAGKVEMPNHLSKMKQLNRGRLLFYVTFDGGYAYLDVNSLLENLGLNR